MWSPSRSVPVARLQAAEASPDAMVRPNRDGCSADRRWSRGVVVVRRRAGATTTLLAQVGEIVPRPRTQPGGRTRSLITLGVVLLSALLVSACLPGQVSEVISHDAASGYATVGVETRQSCTYRLDGDVSGWIGLMAVEATPADGVVVENARPVDLPPGGRLWRPATDPQGLTTTEQDYRLWDGSGLGERLTAGVLPGESFRVQYTTRAADRGRELPAAQAEVAARVVDGAGEPLPITELACDGGLLTSLPGLEPSRTSIDWPDAQSVQDAALSGGLVLYEDPVFEFFRNIAVCGLDSLGEPPDPIEPWTMLVADHGSDVTVGVIGDSVTSQVRDELVADTRFDWVIGSMCATRLDHYLGAPLVPDRPDLSFAVDQVLAADPDVVIVALGSVDVLHFPELDHAGRIDQMLTLLDDVPCPLWLNVVVPPSVNPDYPDFQVAAQAFNADLSGLAAAHRTTVLDFDAAAQAVAAGPSHPWLLGGTDLFHMSVPVGHQARVGMMLDGVAACTG